MNEMPVNIQWFPGHMAKALKQFKANLPKVDIVFELVDARCPYSSINPEIKKISKDKPHLLILTKSDLADPKMTQHWLHYFRHHGYAAIAIDSKQHVKSGKIAKAARQILGGQLEHRHQRGIKSNNVRAICVGIPNVGKSTLLNQLVHRRAAQVGNTPGVTKGTQWLRSGNGLLLLDTPGILWHKFQNQTIADKISLVGSVKAGQYYNDDVALYALKFFRNHHPDELAKRYRLTKADFNLNDVDLLLKITKNVGMRDDYDRASLRVILDTRKEKLGRFTLDDVAKVEA